LETKAAAAAIARSILAPRVNKFSEEYDREMKKVETYHGKHLKALQWFQTMEVKPDDMSVIHQFWRDHIIKILWLTAGAGPAILYDARDWVKDMNLADDMPPDLANYTCNLLGSVNRILRKASGKGRGKPSGRSWDAPIAEALGCMSEALPLKRPANLRHDPGELESPKESRCSIVREVMEELGVKKSEAAIEDSCERAREVFDLFTELSQCLRTLMAELGYEPAAIEAEMARLSTREGRQALFEALDKVAKSRGITKL
jgi:hypothetical protein